MVTLGRQHTWPGMERPLVVGPHRPGPNFPDEQQQQRRSSGSSSYVSFDSCGEGAAAALGGFAASCHGARSNGGGGSHNCAPEAGVSGVQATQFTALGSQAMASTQPCAPPALPSPCTPPGLATRAPFCGIPVPRVLPFAAGAAGLSGSLSLG